MMTSPSALEMIWPGTASVMVFLGIVGAVAASLIAATHAAFSSDGAALARRRAWQAAAIVAALLAATASLAACGLLGRLAGTRALVVYPLGANGLAVALFLSPWGRRLASLPLAALVLFQGFRLPLELVLHAWYQAGALPVQMTYAGQNFDIVTGIAAVAVGLVAWRWPARARPLAALFNVVGTLLLLNVLRVALGSRPFPLGLFRGGPPLALPFHAPFTWILPFCVGPALLGHLVLFRSLARADRRGIRGHAGDDHRQLAISGGDGGIRSARRR